MAEHKFDSKKEGKVMKKKIQKKQDMRLRNRMTVIFLPVICLILASLFSPAYSLDFMSSQAPAVPESFTDLAKKSSPAVVNISTVKTIKDSGQMLRHFFGIPQGPGNPNDQFNEFFKNFFNNLPQQQLKETSLGSGFIYDKEGYIITNNHVVDESDQIKVKLKDNKQYDAKIIGKDAVTDLALLKIEANEDLTALPLGDSNKLEIGQWVIAIGNPFGLADTVTAGIVSAKGRVIGAGPYDDFIQTDASINPGNSGGPLINMQGEVVGINSAIIAGGGGGIGFAIPVNMAKNVISQLKKNGEVVRGWLGVGIQDLDEQLKSYYQVQSGVLVTEVFAGDPAEKAGIESNDVILAVNGKPVNSARELSMEIAAIPIGEKADIKIDRKGEILDKKVTIVKREENKVAQLGKEEQTPEGGPLGLQVSNITPQIARQLQLKDREGVVVLDVESGSQADKAGMSKGDLIREINHKKVKNISDYNRIIDEVKAKGTLEFLIQSPVGGYHVVKLEK